MANAGPWSDVNKEVANVVAQETIDSLESLGFTAMTPVQRMVLPRLLNYKDCAVEAVTGSGKTLAFLVPAIEFIRKSTAKGLTVLILLPTRDLAKQIASVVEPFKQAHPYIVTQLVTGGTSSVDEDMAYVKTHNPNMMIATPGRLHELISAAGPSILRGLELFVVDEADRILDMGMAAHLSAVFDSIPRQRRTGLFSATLTDALRSIIRVGMRNPMFLKVKSETAVPEELSNFFAIANPKNKVSQLVEFVRTECPSGKVIIFLLTCQMVEYFTEVLRILLGEGRQILPFHGKMKHEDREKNLSDFRSLTDVVFVSTDVAARGIDIPDVDWIIQFDAPQNDAMFIHRVGRTARIGRKGSALLFLREHEEEYRIFLQGKDVDLIERSVPVPDDCDEMLMKLRQASKDDEEFYKKSIVAMVSYARAYGEHNLGLLFQKKEVDFVALGNSFGLVRMPGMPELKNRTEETQEYNALYAEYAAPWQDLDARTAAREQREKVSKRKQKKKQRSAEEEINMCQKKFRTGAFRPRRK